jgi:putative membrane protein
VTIALHASIMAIGQGWSSGGHSWFFGPLFWLLPVFLFGALVFLVARWAAGTGGRQGNQAGRGDVGILEERYARGEITREQFEQMKKDLQG